MADTSHADLSSICSHATIQFRDVTRRVAGYDKIAFALGPRKIVVGMVGSDTGTLEVAMVALILRVNRSHSGGGEVDVDDGNISPCFSSTKHHDKQRGEERRMSRNKHHVE